MNFKLYSISVKGLFFPKYIIESDGEVVYTVKKKGLFGSTGFHDELGNELLTLKRKFSFFKIQFELLRRDIHHAFIELERPRFKNNYIVDSPYHYYYCDGDVWMTEFTVIEDNDNEVAKISRKRRARKHRYGIAMTEHADSNLVLALAIAIELTRKIKRSRKTG